MLDIYSKGHEFNLHPSMVENNQNFVFCHQLKWHAQESNSWHFGVLGLILVLGTWVLWQDCLLNIERESNSWHFGCKGPNFFIFL